MYRLVSHEYFMDEMNMLDLAVMKRHIDYVDLLDFARTRLLMLSVLSPYLKKGTTAQDILHLPIDDIDKEQGRTDVTNEEMDWFKKVKQQFNQTSQKES
jgi:hypothetical protein